MLAGCLPSSHSPSATYIRIHGTSFGTECRSYLDQSHEKFGARHGHCHILTNLLVFCPSATSALWSPPTSSFCISDVFIAYHTRPYRTLPACLIFSSRPFLPPVYNSKCAVLLVL